MVIYGRSWLVMVNHEGLSVCLADAGLQIVKLQALLMVAAAD